jgi:hypothetical protein
LLRHDVRRLLCITLSTITTGLLHHVLGVIVIDLFRVAKPRALRPVLVRPAIILHRLLLLLLLLPASSCWHGVRGLLLLLQLHEAAALVAAAGLLLVMVRRRRRRAGAAVLTLAVAVLLLLLRPVRRRLRLRLQLCGVLPRDPQLLLLVDGQLQRVIAALQDVGLL